MLSPEAEYLYRRILNNPSNTVYSYSALEHYILVGFKGRSLTVPEIESAILELLDIQVIAYTDQRHYRVYRVLETPELIYGITVSDVC